MSNDSKPGGGMAWIKARLLLRAQRRRRVQSLETWPDSLTPEELACLQYPWEGTPAEKRKAVSLQREMAGLLRAAIQGGEIESVSVPVAVPIYEDRADILAIHRSGGIGRRSAAGLMRYGDPPPTVRTKVGEQTNEIPTLTRHGSATWLRQMGEEESEYVKAWLESGDRQTGSGRKKVEETKQFRREEVLREWLAGAGRQYLENDKLTLTRLQAWGQLEKLSGIFEPDASQSTIESFFKIQRLVRFKPGNRG